MSQLHNYKNTTNYCFKSTIFSTVNDHLVFLLTKTHDSNVGACSQLLIECQVKLLNTPGISYNEMVMKKFKRAMSGYLLSY